MNLDAETDASLRVATARPWPHSRTHSLSAPYDLFSAPTDDEDRRLRQTLLSSVAHNEAARRVTAPKPRMSAASRSAELLLTMKALKPSLGAGNLANRNPHSSAYVAEEDNRVGWLEAYEKADRLQDEMLLNPKKKTEAVEFKAPMARLVRRSSRHKMSVKIQQVVPGMFGGVGGGHNRFLKKFHHDEDHRARSNSKGLHLNIRNDQPKGPFSGLAKAFESSLLRKSSMAIRQTGQKVQFSSSLFRNQVSLTGSGMKDQTERNTARLETRQNSIRLQKKISPGSVTKMTPSNWSSSSPRRTFKDTEALQSPTKVTQGKQLRNLPISSQPKVPTDQQSQSIEEVAEAIIKRVEFEELPFNGAAAHRKTGRFKIGTQVFEDRKSKSPARKKRGSVQLDVDVQTETPMITLSKFGQITLDSIGEQRPVSHHDSKAGLHPVVQDPKPSPKTNLKPIKSSRNLHISPRKHHSSRWLATQNSKQTKASPEGKGFLLFNPPPTVPRYFGDPTDGGSLNLEIPEVEDHSMSDPSPAADHRAGERLDSVHWGHLQQDDPYSRISPGPGPHNPQALFSPSHNSIPVQQPLFEKREEGLHDPNSETVLQDTHRTGAPETRGGKQTASWSRFFTRDDELSEPLGLLQGTVLPQKNKRLWTTERLGLGTDSSRRAENLFVRDFQGVTPSIGSTVKDLLSRSPRLNQNQLRL